MNICTVNKEEEIKHRKSFSVLVTSVGNICSIERWVHILCAHHGQLFSRTSEKSITFPHGLSRRELTVIQQLLAESPPPPAPPPPRREGPPPTPVTYARFSPFHSFDKKMENRIFFHSFQRVYVSKESLDPPLLRLIIINWTISVRTVLTVRKYN